MAKSPKERQQAKRDRNLAAGLSSRGRPLRDAPDRDARDALLSNEINDRDARDAVRDAPPKRKGFPTPLPKENSLSPGGELLLFPVGSESSCRTRARANPVPVPLPDSFVLDDYRIDRAATLAGWNARRCELEIEKFRAFYGRDGRCFADWNAAWCSWCLMGAERDAKRSDPYSIEGRLRDSERALADLHRRANGGS